MHITRKVAGRRLITLPLVALTFLALVLAGAGTAQAHQSPSIWVGAPTAATWGVTGDASTTPSANHHKLVKATLGNDWAVDLPADGGTSAYLYVAPSSAAHNGDVTTRVTQIIDDNACRNGGGGDLVTVAIYYKGASYGQVTYAHLDRNPGLYEGQSVSRWGTWLGNVASLRGQSGDCWTGAHIHTELRATTQYACWNRGYSYSGYPIRPSNFLGFISGPLNASRATPCP